jgi:predicted phage tail protein
MVEAADSGSEFQFIIDESRGLTAEQLNMPIGGQRMMLTEAVMGEKGGAFGIIEAVVGVILIAAAEIYSFGSATPFIIGLGGSLIVGGITSLLTTLPTQTGAAGDTLSSFYFNGPANTQQQGLPVPVVYGRALIGSTAISASMQAVDLASAPAETGNLS